MPLEALQAKLGPVEEARVGTAPRRPALGYTVLHTRVRVVAAVKAGSQRRRVPVVGDDLVLEQAPPSTSRPPDLPPLPLEKTAAAVAHPSVALRPPPSVRRPFTVEVLRC